MTILHLTDIHFGQPVLTAHWSAAKRAFLDDLDHLVSQSSPVSLVVITGDIANTGDLKDYLRATDFLEELFGRLRTVNPEVQLFASPGNHDLVRPDADGWFARLMERDRAFVLDKVSDALGAGTDNEFRSAITAAFANYSAWMTASRWCVEDWTPGLMPGDAVGRAKVGGDLIGLISVNTALTQMSDAVAEGTLALLPRQIDELVAREVGREPPLTYVLCTHHPAAWMSKDARELIDNALRANLPIGLHLFGHLHVSEVTTINRGADPRVLHSLQGRSLFGREFLRDGTTKRLHGYTLLSIDTREATVRAAPRNAVPRPSGGVTFEPERGQGWYLPAGSEWTLPLPLLTRDTWDAPAQSSVSVSPSAVLEGKAPSSDGALFSAITDAVTEGLEPSRPAHWYRPPAHDEMLRTLELLISLDPGLVRPTPTETAYIWALISLVAARADLVGGRFAGWESFATDLEWSRDHVRTVTENERLATRAGDQHAPVAVRAMLGEWLMRRAILSSGQVWDTAELRSAARRLAVGLRCRADDVESLARRLREEATVLSGGTIARTHLTSSWALATTDGQLVHMRPDVVLPFAFAVLAMEFDIVRDGSELVEQIGVVPSFELDLVKADLDRAHWVTTSEGRLARVAECFDPAVDVALRTHCLELAKRAQQLPSSHVADVLRRAMTSTVDVSGIRPQTIDAGAAYATPVTRIVMDTERIRSLLMGEQLYGQARLAIRELYQNSLDACRYRALRQRYLAAVGAGVDQAWRGRIQFDASYDEVGNLPVLQCEDDGVGMERDILSACFLSAGSRFVETPRFADEQANWLAVDDALRLFPNSTFGIGAFSYFMLADVVEVLTRPQRADGTFGEGSRLQINAGSSVARLSDWREAALRLPLGGTIVRLHLRPEYRSVSRLQLSNFLDETVLRSPFELVVTEGHELNTRAPEDFSPEVRSPHVVAWSQGESAAWWRIVHGTLLADGIKTPSELVGIMVNLHGDKKPTLRVDRNAVVRFDEAWVLDRTAECAESLANWGGLSLAWLWQFAERYPTHGQKLFDDLLRIRHVVPLGQSQHWEAEVDLHTVGCFPGDRYLLSELGDPRRRESEYPEIEIPAITRDENRRFGGLTVRFPSCLRPWRRRVWLQALPELFEGWEPDARELLGAPVETVRSPADNLTPVWEPEELAGLASPGPLDAALIASQPSITSISIGPAEAGHQTVVDTVALIHGAHRTAMTLGAAVERLAQFVRFGLRGLPALAEDSYDYVPSLLDCRIVAALGRAWPTSRRLSREDLLFLAPLCQEHGLTIREAVDAAGELMRRLGIRHAQPSGSPDVYADHVPSLREVRFLGFGEYDVGRELRFGRGTRAALIRASFRGDMHWEEVSKVVRRYAGFGLQKYRSALRLPDLQPDNPEYLRAWSANFDSRAPWVDEEVFRRGFWSDRPSSADELLGHAVFYSVLAGVTLRVAAERVAAFPGLAKDQQIDTQAVPDAGCDERDLEMLRSRIGRTSGYSDKRLAGIGQEQLVRRRWSILELKAASRGLNAPMSEVFDRLGKFRFLGVELPSCGPDVVETYEFTELESALLTSKDHTLGAFGRFAGFHDDDTKPIIGPIPPYQLMRVAHDEKVPLGHVSEVLDALQILDVERGAAPVPPSLADYTPSGAEVGLARRLRHVSLGYGIAEEALRRGSSIGYVCDLVAPWLGWFAADAESVDRALGLLRDASADLVPSYTGLSFMAAAEALARANRNRLDGRVVCVLAAQANASMATAVEFAMRFASVLSVDGVTVDVGERHIARWSDLNPDSRWVIAVDKAAIAGPEREAMYAHLGVGSEFLDGVRRLLRT